MANSPLLQIPLLSASQVGKETTINSMVGYLERAMNDAVTLNLAGGNLVLPATDLQRYMYFKIASGGTSSVLTITKMKRMFVIDNLSNGNVLTIDCGTDTLSIPAGGICTVMCDGTNLISVTDSTIMGAGVTGVTTFTGLSDVPSSYAGKALYVVRVNTDSTALEFVPVSSSLLADFDIMTPADGDVLTWVAADSKFKNLPNTGGGGISGTTTTWHNSVRVATAGPLSIVDELIDGAVIDGITLAIGDRILVWQQTAQSENGIYYIKPDGTAERSSDANTEELLAAGTTTVVLFGTYEKTVFIQTEDVVLLGAGPVIYEKTTAGMVGDLSNVDLTGLSDGKFLKWDETIAMWVPGTFTASGLPLGGTMGQALVKLSNDDGDVVWDDLYTPPATVGNGGKLLAVKADGSGYELIDPPASGGGSDRTIAFFIGGKPAASETVLRLPITIGFDLTSLAGSFASAGTATTAACDFLIKRNGATIVTASFAAGSATATFSGAGAAFVAGDILSITAPATQDATLADVSIALKGTLTV